MSKLTEKNRALMIGRAKGYFEDGMSVSEVAAKLKLTESEVRECKAVIDKAEENRKKK